MEVSIYRLRLQDILTICVLALLMLGVIMVQSASTNVTGEAHWQWSALGLKHLAFVGLSIITFFAVGHLNYSGLGVRAKSIVRSPVTWVYFVAAGACLLVLIPHVGTTVNGARRWLRFGPVQIQPSELAKWGAVIFLAYRLTRDGKPLNRFFRDLLPTLVPIGVLCLLVVKEDFGTAALIGLCTLLMLLVGRVKFVHLVVLLFPVIAAAGFFVLHSTGGYRMRRITAFLHPWDSPQGEGYHMIQSLLSFATGGIFGRGLGNGIQKLGYLPEDTTDFIFAVVCEELGLFGAMLVIALYLGVIYVAWQAVRNSKTDFGRMLGFGIGAMVGVQAAINIAVATVSVPTKGMSLPLISAGGSGLVITCAALGLLYSIARLAKEDRATLPMASQDLTTGSIRPAELSLRSAA